MPLSLRRGSVTAVTERLDGLVRLTVDGLPCVAYPRITGDVEVGDDVLVNVQASELSLGSGGYDIVYANLTRGIGLPVDEGAHVMSLPYTPGQRAVRYVEEDGSDADGLRGLPVVCCTVHSQVAPVCAALAARRVAYVQVAGGALPVALSDVLRTLRERALVDVTIGVAPCSDADVAALTAGSALLWAEAMGFEAVVCSVGPGIVGTGSRYGHGAATLADVVNASFALGGSPVLAARVSDLDPRPRHRGLSHHTRAVLALCPTAPVRVPWPRGAALPEGVTVEEADADGWRAACAGLPLSFMGRSADEEPAFFATAYAAGVVGARLADERGRGGTKKAQLRHERVTGPSLP